ncbi:tyrosine-type recombinase/integrase [Candidatus Latescibacterota bacterium]
MASRGRPKNTREHNVYSLDQSPYWMVRFLDKDTGKIVRRSTGYINPNSSAMPKNPDPSITLSKMEVQELYDTGGFSYNAGEFTIRRLEDHTIKNLRIKKASDNTIDSYRQAFRHLKKVYPEDLNIKKLNKGMETEIKQHMYDRNLKNGTINITLSTIKASLQSLVDDEKLLRNPLEKVERLPVDRQKHFTKEQLKRFLDHLETVKNENGKHLLRILTYTGIRRSELLNIRREDVNLETMEFTRVNIKSRDKHSVCRKFNNEIWKDFNYFIQRNSDKKYPFNVMCGNRLTSLFRQYRRDAGLPDWAHLHTLRHTFITLCLENGMPLRVMQKYVDHADSGTTEAYAHDVPEQIPEFNIV